MSKIPAAVLFIVAAFSMAVAQESSATNPASQGVGPKVENGVGRADVRVFDENGNPIRNAYVKLESTRTDGFFCESWDNTNERGITVLPPIHMGSLKLIVRAKGFQKQELNVPANELGEPVHVTLHKK